ncbi:MAG TPA: gamma-glutamyltransferase [Candidatus Acidoferrales bacterium]|jgi:gamma-glutamyltranspeptidase/glutathione hydrolase|nr:gamma-glutamyltransferase [Candidatus Acidoferrales bacterium]
MRLKISTVIVLFALSFVCAPILRAQAVPTDVKAGEVPHPEWPREAVRAPKAMVVSDEELASQAGVEILKRGGNAVDAAVAVAFALAVVEPAAGNIGGGGFMLVRLADGRTGFVDYRETAPKKASRDMYIRANGTLDSDSATIGYRAAAIPATVAGMELALKTYGSLKLRDVMAPAIRLAEQGFPISEKLARSLRASRPLLQRFSTSRRIFLKDGALYQPGETLRQSELAATLRRIASGGAAEFYSGETARELADEMARMGGIITLEDLAGYKAKIREPLRGKYSANGSEWEVIAAPPPSSGGTAMLSALNILAPVELKNWNDAQSVHWVVETMRRVFADRAAFLADTDFSPVPVRGLIDPRYAEQRRATIDPRCASSSEQIRAGNPMPFDAANGPAGTTGTADPSPAPMNRDGLGMTTYAQAAGLEGGHTTHFSVVDAAGNAVSNTYTINESYGSGVTTTTGFLLNDTMDDFTTQVGVPNKLFGLIQSDANAIAPGKRSLSSMTPTIVLRDGKLSLVTGSPGGPRIISASLLSVLNWMRLSMDAQAAINAPRFHHQWMPDTVYVEEIFPAEVRKELEQRGHKITQRSWIGQVEAIGIDAKTGERLGAADARRMGAAVGY